MKPLWLSLLALMSHHRHKINWNTLIERYTGSTICDYIFDILSQVSNNGFICHQPTVTHTKLILLLSVSLCNFVFGMFAFSYFNSEHVYLVCSLLPDMTATHRLCNSTFCTRKKSAPASISCHSVYFYLQPLVALFLVVKKKLE